ncbi:MAG: NAD(P)H-dependent glycerol-3-phosphate dehydrogenase [Mycoplasmatales bacterium]
MKVCVLGGGSFGGTIAKVLSENNVDVTLWSHLESDSQQLRDSLVVPHVSDAKLSDTINFTSDLSLANDADMIVVVVPSFALRETAEKLNEVLDKDKIFVVCTKGLESSTMKSGYEIIKDIVNYVESIVILSGPTHAEELAVRKYTTIVSTSSSKEARELVQETFANDYLRVYTNDDIKGVEILGAAKNILAIAAGFCDSHPMLGDNAKAAILTRGLRELKIIGEYENCKPETFYGLTGLGDLIVTAMSKHSRNRKFGELIGTGLTTLQAQETIGMVVEGLYSVKAINQLKIKNNLDLPIIEAIYQVLYNEADIEVVIVGLLKRENKSEV